MTHDHRVGLWVLGAKFGVLGSRVWVQASVGVAVIFLCVATIFLMNRPTRRVADKPAGAPSFEGVAAQVPSRPQPSQTIASGASAEPAGSVVRRAPRSETPLLPAPGDLTPLVDPLAVEPIADDPLQVSALEVVSEPIDEITIVPLVIEPLTASND